MCESDAIRLVRAARQGDAAAFAQLVSRHYPVLLRGAEPAELVALFYIAGLTRAEVAAELGTPARAVKTRLHKARRTLRASLHDTYEEYIAMPEPSPALIPMHVTGLRRAEPGKGHIVVLEDAAGRRLPIWIGAPEATAMALILEHVEMPRPGVHQFAAALLAGAGGTLAEVRITELTESVFYAQAILADGTRIDARPSDALTLALLSDAPIYVAAGVLDANPPSELLDEAAAAVDASQSLAAEAQARLGEIRRTYLSPNS
jgi:bifunctional DNase/RNase